MYDFILQVIVMLSLGTAVYLIARAIPRVSEAPAPAVKKNYFDELVKRIPFEKIDAFLNAAAAKILRRVKVFIMKVDNLITGYLNKIKPASGAVKELLNIEESDKNQQ